MKTIHLKTPLGNSEILIEKNALKKASILINKHHKDKRTIIVTDDNLHRIYGKELKKIFPDALLFVVSAGEDSKRMEVVMNITKEMMKDGVTRSDILIGFGGGMITDLAGFIASVYMRGMSYIAIPTSLLCMVDASIGGKTGVNSIAKNSIGSFYPAEFILVDPDFLKTLPKRDLATGFGEVVKYAAILDSSLCDDFKKDELDFLTIIKKSVKAKVNVCEKDVKEGGLRKVLNYGHTFAHAVEELTNYKVTHGEAVAIGMVLSNKVAQALGRQVSGTGNILRDILKQFNLPTELPKGITPDKMLKYIKNDKKRHGKTLTFVIAPRFGEFEFVELEPEKLVELIK